MSMLISYKDRDGWHDLTFHNDCAQSNDLLIRTIIEWKAQGIYYCMCPLPR